MATMIDSYVAEAERAASAGRQGDPAWLTETRRHGLERFTALGFPTTREEEWRFTSVAPIAERRFVLAKNGTSALRPQDLDRLRLPGTTAATLVFANGRYVPSVSDIRGLPAGVRIDSLGVAMRQPANAIEKHLTRAASADRHAFTALNTAFLLDGAFLSVPDGIQVETPIQFVFLAIGDEPETLAHPRVLVVMGAGSKASIVES